MNEIVCTVLAVFFTIALGVFLLAGAGFMVVALVKFIRGNL